MIKILILLTSMLFAEATIFAQKQYYTHKFATMRTSVLKHYSGNVQDSLKLKAAEFILGNMYQRKFLLCPQLKPLINKLDNIHRTEKYTSNYGSLVSAIDSFYVRYNEPHVAYEYDGVTADDIIREIDDAFAHWGQESFGRHLSFEEFCEYILPPVLGHTYYTPWRQLYSRKYRGVFERLFISDDRRHSAFHAAAKTNYTLRHNGVNIKAIELPLGINYPADKLINMRTGSCRDFAILAAYTMRAYGIPVAVDFTPQWPNRAGGHYWNSLLSDNGHNVPFSGAQSDPGFSFYPESPMAKVYRMTYAYQENSLPAKMKNSKVYIPQSLQNPFMIDVTAEYTKTAELTIKTDMADNLGNVMFISVFNNQNWIAVDYAMVIDGVATFKNLGIGVVYLPSFWDKSEGPLGGISPVEITRSGEIRIIEPDMNKRLSLTLTRKYPVMSGILGYSERMQGGYIEASNEKDFPESSTRKMGEITKFPAMRWDSITVNKGKESFRYWRYVSPKAGWCDIAEAQFISDGSKLDSENIIANTFRNDSHNPKSAFDGRAITYYESNKANVGWIGLDFGKTVCIDTFRYLPRNDDNYVTEGHEYELEVYVHGVPTSLGKVKAIGNSVTFDNVPVGGLYILHDLSGGYEERIFTYEKGKVIWH